MGSPAMESKVAAQILSESAAVKDAAVVKEKSWRDPSGIRQVKLQPKRQI